MKLTKPQKQIYDMEKYAGGAIAVICGSMLIDGKKNETDLVGAVREIFRLNDALRIRISEVNDDVCQTVGKYVEPDVETLYFENKSELDNYADDFAKVPLELAGELCVIKVIVLPEQYGILVKLHHMVGDAWTLSMIGTQFNSILNGEAVECYSYTDYIENEQVYLQGKRYEKDKEFFLDQFKKCDEVIYLSEKQTETLNARRKTFVIDCRDTKLITDYVQQKNTSAFTLFTAALAAYINRTKMNAEKFYVGVAVLNRSGMKEKNTMGMFVNTVPMLIELDNDKSFEDNMLGIQKSAFSIFRHQKFNYGDVLSEIRKEYGFTERLYDVIISYQNASITGEDIETTWYHSGSQNESLQIHIDDRDNKGIFRIHYDYSIEKFTEQEIDSIHEHLCNLLFDALENDEKKLYELDVLSPDEKQKLLFEFNDTAADYPRDKCIHQLFEEQAAKTPDDVAVIACDKTLTYDELNKLANKIANGLIKKGIGRNEIVAFALPRDSYLIAVIFGILKSGAAYLPIDLDYPQDRIDYMINDSNAKYFITVNNLNEFAEDNEDSPNVEMSSDDYCYCIYTSGTTGKPKGILITHRNVSNFTKKTVKNEFQNVLLSNCEQIIVSNSITFDITLQEIHLPLINGLPIILLSEKESNNIGINTKLQDKKNLGLITTPTRISMYMQNEKFCKLLCNFSVIMCGAEDFIPNSFSKIREFTMANIFNGYGPTETSCGASYSLIDDENEISIGKPIANTQVYILDKYEKIVPIGVTGELCIAGDGVGAGYLNRPELTAEKFIDNPFGDGKLYKTGDLAYWREDGNIAYVGRNDFQVKIRGLRIELGEIENAICSAEGISQAVVVVRKDGNGRQLICAFYTGVKTDAKKIRSYISQKLPKYMMPHIFTYLDEMPMTSSGKIDRKALPKVNLDNIAVDTEYVAPQNNRQKELCRLMGQVLGVSNIGIADDFFDLGGDSLKAIEFVSKAHNEGIYFNLQNVFDYPTVASLCECIEKEDKNIVSFADTDFSQIDKILQENDSEESVAPSKAEIGNILLVGATGYLGIHILADYLDNDTGTAICVVRGKNEEDSVNRLNELLEFYFGDKYSGASRIKVICSDITDSRFGLKQEEYSTLTDSVEMVINCAASVKHYGTYSYFYEANVETTKALIQFCRQSNAKLIHISTLSVSGNGFEGNDGSAKVFSEKNLYIGQPLNNVYARSKFEAEKAVLDAVADGLSANIMRMGNLTNRNADGVFQKNYETNAFAKRIRAFLELKAFPGELADFKVEFTPIDEAAKAVMTIAHHFNDKNIVFHINNPKTVPLGKLFGYFNRLGYEQKEITEAEFRELFRDKCSPDEVQQVLEAFINDMDEDGRLKYSNDIQTENEFTVKYLRKLGFEWPDIGMEYLRKYVEYFKKLEYFN